VPVAAATAPPSAPSERSQTTSATTAAQDPRATVIRGGTAPAASAAVQKVVVTNPSASGAQASLDATSLQNFMISELAAIRAHLRVVGSRLGQLFEIAAISKGRGVDPASCMAPAPASSVRTTPPLLRPAQPDLHSINGSSLAAAGIARATLAVAAAPATPGQRVNESAMYAGVSGGVCRLATSK
jgi:hypothetical protein